jgi:hypothetical protein
MNFPENAALFVHVNAKISLSKTLAEEKHCQYMYDMAPVRPRKQKYAYG